MRLWIAALLIAGLVITQDNNASADDRTISLSDSAKTKINLAGRQRMLTQKMAKAACFFHLGVEPDFHLEQIKSAQDLFNRTLQGLKDGDLGQGMRPERNPEILKNLKKIDALWIDYSRVNHEIDTQKSLSRPDLQRIADLNIPILRQIHRTVAIAEKVYGNSGAVTPTLAVALNISGRQRMLSQKASKEFCLIHADINPDKNRKALAVTQDLFTSSLRDLIHGNAALNLMPAPTKKIEAQLNIVKQHWDQLSPLLQKPLEGETPSRVDVENLTHSNMKLLRAMNEAVFMYNAL